MTTQTMIIYTDCKQAKYSLFLLMLFSESLFFFHTMYYVQFERYTKKWHLTTNFSLLEMVVMEIKKNAGEQKQSQQKQRVKRWIHLCAEFIELNRRNMHSQY